ncbi:MAG: TolC family protein [Phycisphaerales bacterium]|nr:TolC family protein [Phycisphaerales bacterium]
MFEAEKTLSLVVIGAVMLAGCRHYERKPLDLEAHRQAWSRRDPGGADIAAFAAQLGNDGASGEFNPADGLSLAEAEVVALFFNPQLRTARQRARVTAASAEYAGLWDDPVLDFDVLRIVESVPDPWIVGGFLGFTIPLSGRLEAEKSLASAEHSAELARIAAREWQIITELRARWIEWSAARLRAELTAQISESIQRVISAVDKLEQVGELPRIQTRLFRIEAVTRASEARVLRGRAAELELSVKSLLGVVPEAPVELVPSVAVSLAAFPAGQRRILLVESNPSLAVLQAEYESAEQTLRREIRKQYPDLGIGPAYENEDDQSRIGLIGSIPIPILNRNKQGIAVAEAEREAARAAVEAQYERLVHDLAQAEARFGYLSEARAQLEETLVPLVEEQARDAQRLLELGEFDVLVQLESLQRLLDAKLRLIEAREAEAGAASALAALLGPATRNQTQGSHP